MKIGTVLRLIRTLLELDQSQMAKKLNLSSTYLSQIETGYSEPSWKLMQKMSKCLSSSDDALIFISLDVPYEIARNSDDEDKFKLFQKKILVEVMLKNEKASKAECLT